MIEINLSSSKKGSINNVMGMDLSQLNVKMLVVALILLYVPESFLLDMWESELQSHRTKYSQLKKEERKVQQKVRSMENIKKQVDALKNQEKSLAAKLTAVKEVINKRQNPFNIMKYITENMPQNVWVDHFSINQNDLTLKGYASSWKYIKEFLDALKSSIFFDGGSIDYTRPPDMKTEYKNRKVEVFQIKAKVARFK